MSVHPLLVLFATLCGTPLFERWQKVTLVEIAAEKAPGIVAFSEESAGLRGCAAGREG